MAPFAIAARLTNARAQPASLTIPVYTCGGSLRLHAARPEYLFTALSLSKTFACSAAILVSTSGTNFDR